MTGTVYQYCTAAHPHVSACSMRIRQHSVPTNAAIQHEQPWAPGEFGECNTHAHTPISCTSGRLQSFVSDRSAGMVTHSNKHLHS